VFFRENSVTVFFAILLCASAQATRLADMAAEAPAAQDVSKYVTMVGTTWIPTAEDTLFPIDKTNFWVLTDGSRMVTVDVRWLGRLGQTGDGAVRLIEAGEQTENVRTYAIAFDPNQASEGWADAKAAFEGEVWLGDDWLPGLDWEPTDPYATASHLATVTLKRGVGPVAMTATDGTVFSLKYAVVDGTPFK
jgi:hypothetical protein